MPNTLRSSREDVLNDEECKVLLAACRDPLDHLVIRLALYCGMRVGEIQHMTRTWIIWERDIIEVASRQRCDCYECRKWRKRVWSPKSTAGIRNLLIVDEVRSTLADFFSVNAVVGRSRQALEQRCERIRRRSGLLVPVYCHCLRATFSTRLAEEGMSAPSLSYVMGWSGLDSAEHYIQSSMKRAHYEQQQIIGKTLGKK